MKDPDYIDEYEEIQFMKIWGNGDEFMYDEFNELPDRMKELIRRTAFKFTGKVIYERYGYGDD
jgi:hypothetical protein